MPLSCVVRRDLYAARAYGAGAAMQRVLFILSALLLLMPAE